MTDKVGKIIFQSKEEANDFIDVANRLLGLPDEKSQTYADYFTDEGESFEIQIAVYLFDRLPQIWIDRIYKD